MPDRSGVLGRLLTKLPATHQDGYYLLADSDKNQHLVRILASGEISKESEHLHVMHSRHVELVAAGTDRLLITRQQDADDVRDVLLVLGNAEKYNECLRLGLLKLDPQSALLPQVRRSSGPATLHLRFCSSSFVNSFCKDALCYVAGFPAEQQEKYVLGAPGNAYVLQVQFHGKVAKQSEYLGVLRDRELELLTAGNDVLIATRLKPNSTVRDVFLIDGIALHSYWYGDSCLSLKVANVFSRASRVSMLEGLESARKALRSGGTKLVFCSSDFQRAICKHIPCSTIPSRNVESHLGIK